MFRQTPVAPAVNSRRTPSAPENGTGGKALPSPDADVAAGAPTHQLPPVELGPIIKAKIQPPALRASTLSRQRLIDQLREATSHRLTLLIAEAGYGKTTLLADFARVSGLRTLWYRLDPTDADVITWANHIVAAAREVEPKFGEATLRLMSQLAAGGPPKSAFVSSVLGELGELEPVPTLLVLDDFHGVDESPDAIEFVTRLVRDAPPWLRIVISSRRKPSLGLGRLTASDELVEIATDELRFSRDETVRLFAESYGTPLDDDVLSDLDARTKGWVASLQLFHGSIRGRSPSAVRALAHQLSGATSPIYDFLAEEVLANLPPHLERFLLRASLLERITDRLVVPLFSDPGEMTTERAAREWIDEAERLTLLIRFSQVSDVRLLHPLLRDFLVRRLTDLESERAVQDMHLRVARDCRSREPLTAAHHFLEGGDSVEAMRCMGSSVMLTMGSGQWGLASDLIERMSGVAAEPAVAAIQARNLIEVGRYDDAADILRTVDLTAATPEVRAVTRHARISLGWRTGDRTLIYSALKDVQNDVETPPILKDIFQTFVDASSLADKPTPLSQLAARLVRMSDAQQLSGHTYFAAISASNGAVAHLHAGDYQAAVDACGKALTAFGDLAFFAVEQLSTHTIMAIAHSELGNNAAASRHARDALSRGSEFVDVVAELACIAQLTGEETKAADLRTRARLLKQQGRTDVFGDAIFEAALAIGEMSRNAEGAADLLSEPVDSPLDLGYSMSRDTLRVQALLLAGRSDEARQLIEVTTPAAALRGATRALVRLAVLSAIEDRDVVELERAVGEAKLNGELALLEVADALVASFDFVHRLPAAVDESIAAFPGRWLPRVRRQLATGNTASGRLAAAVLDRHGTVEDVGLLRAYAKTYSKRGVERSLGKRLARRVSPKVLVDDLGRVQLSVGDRTIPLTAIRRKPASVLMFLVTRPEFAANREQVIDALWPDSDPTSAANNLNQSLYFLRREIDPWYEDDVSVDYVGFQGDLVWLDKDLVASRSADFVRCMADRSLPFEREVAMIRRYTAPFAPEFEYEDWALSWRTRAHSTFLEAAYRTIGRLASDFDFHQAKDIAAHVLQVDPAATDFERRIIWLYARLKLDSPARTQYQHLAAQDRFDGVDPPSFEDMVQGSIPD